MTRITVSTLRWVPPFAQGLVRDLRVRWALEAPMANFLKYAPAA